MNIKEKVKKRWGNRGAYSSNCKRPTGERSYRVGYVECGFFNVVGEGASWAEALANADKKIKKESVK